LLNPTVKYVETYTAAITNCENIYLQIAKPGPAKTEPRRFLRIPAQTPRIHVPFVRSDKDAP
jgi:hypothetical protein